MINLEIAPSSILVERNDTPTVSSLDEHELSHLFHLNFADIHSFDISHDRDSIFLNITLKQKFHTCPVCLNKTNNVKDYHIKKIKHSIINTKQCYINYNARRYVCRHCKKIFYENNPFSIGYSKFSVATVYNVLKDLKSPSETFTRVAQRHNISITSAINIFDQHISIPRRQLPKYLGIDEVYAFKSHNSQYVCVLVGLLDHSIVDVLPSRRKEDLIKYFSFIPVEERNKVEFCAFDMWETYRSINHLFLKNSKPVVDRFHIIQDLNKRLDKVRISIQNDYKTTINTLRDKKKLKKLTVFEYDLLEEAERQYYVLKKFNWLLFTNDNKILDPNQKKKFNRALNRYCNYYDLYSLMVDGHPSLNEASNLHEEIVQFYKDSSVDTAKKRLENIIDELSNSSLEEFRSLARTYTQWKREMINSFHIIENNKRMNTSIVENRNKQIKLIKHSSNGYLNWDRFRSRVLYSLNSDIPVSLNTASTDRYLPDDH